MTNIAGIVKQCPPFAGLSSAAVAELHSIAVERNVREGTVLFSEGDDAEQFFILIEGAIDLIKSSPEGKEQLVRRVGRGEMFAEAAMFTGESYPATAIARSKSHFIVITKDRFVELVRAHPEISMAIIGTMAKLLRHLNKRLADISLGSVASRLASFLLKRSREEGKTTFPLGISKRDLAYQLGTIPETLSRNFKKMKQAGLIDVHASEIFIKNISGLEDTSRS